KVETVFLETTGVEDAGRRNAHGPEGLAEVADSGPHKIAGNILVGADELPKLLNIDVEILLEEEAPQFGWIVGREKASIIASNAAQCAAFGADNTPVREGCMI